MLLVVFHPKKTTTTTTTKQNSIVGTNQGVRLLFLYYLIIMVFVSASMQSFIC